MSGYPITSMDFISLVSIIGYALQITHLQEKKSRDSLSPLFLFSLIFFHAYDTTTSIEMLSFLRPIEVSFYPHTFISATLTILALALSMVLYIQVAHLQNKPKLLLCLPPCAAFPFFVQLDYLHYVQPVMKLMILVGLITQITYLDRDVRSESIHPLFPLSATIVTLVTFFNTIIAYETIAANLTRGDSTYVILTSYILIELGLRTIAAAIFIGKVFIARYEGGQQSD